MKNIRKSMNLYKLEDFLRISGEPAVVRLRPFPPPPLTEVKGWNKKSFSRFGLFVQRQAVDCCSSSTSEWQCRDQMLFA